MANIFQQVKKPQDLIMTQLAQATEAQKTKDTLRNQLAPVQQEVTKGIEQKAQQTEQKAQKVKSDVQQTTSGVKVDQGAYKNTGESAVNQAYSTPQTPVTAAPIPTTIQQALGSTFQTPTLPDVSADATLAAGTSAIANKEAQDIEGLSKQLSPLQEYLSGLQTGRFTKDGATESIKGLLDPSSQTGIGLEAVQQTQALANADKTSNLGVLAALFKTPRKFGALESQIYQGDINAIRGEAAKQQAEMKAAEGKEQSAITGLKEQLTQSQKDVNKIKEEKTKEIQKLSGEAKASLKDLIAGKETDEANKLLATVNDAKKAFDSANDSFVKNWLTKNVSGEFFGYNNTTHGTSFAEKQAENAGVLESIGKKYGKNSQMYDEVRQGMERAEDVGRIKAITHQLAIDPYRREVFTQYLSKTGYITPQLLKDFGMPSDAKTVERINDKTLLKSLLDKASPGFVGSSKYFSE